MASPFIVHVAACARWRYYRRLAVAGLLTIAASWGLTLWVNLADYHAWSGLPPPRDQVTYLGGFLAMLASWGVCGTYVVAGIVGESSKSLENDRVSPDLHCN